MEEQKKSRAGKSGQYVDGSAVTGKRVRWEEEKCFSYNLRGLLQCVCDMSE